MELNVLIAFIAGIGVGIVLNEWLLPALVDVTFRVTHLRHHHPTQHGR